MAELLVNLENKVCADPIRDAQSYKRGDVVWVAPDGHKWNRNEISGQFILVKVPGLPTEDFNYLLEAEQGDPKVQPLLQRRAQKFDADAYLTAVAAKIVDAQVKGEVVDDQKLEVIKQLQQAEVVALVAEKTALDDSGILIAGLN